MYRVSLGLISMLLSVVLVARSLNILPDPDAAALVRRQAACEAVSIQTALDAQRKEGIAPNAAFAKSITRRNPDALSVGIRDTAGNLIAETGDHETHWAGYTDEKSTPTHMHTQVSKPDGTPLARVEVAFKPLEYSGLWRYVGGSMFPLLAFIWLAGFVLITFYLRLVFRRVDMAGAKVVPDRVKSTLNTLAEGVLVLDKNGVIALANDAFAKGVGRTASELRGKKAADLHWNSGLVELKAEDYPWVRVIREANTQTGQILGLRSGAETRTLSVNSTPIFGDDGECRGALATFDDLTEVEKAKGEAVAASKAKGEFLANVSHEIRTPMNAIIGMTELVLGGKLAGEHRECLDIAKESATSLLAVINDLLDLSKIEAGKFDLQPVEFDPRETLEDVMQAFALRANKKRLELVCDIAADVPRVIVGDPVRLRQVLVNLIGNAVKFTGVGEVVVRVRVLDRTDENVELGFEVVDSGIGVPKDKIRAIFEPFTQADGATTRQYGGTGLGLTISTHLVTLMGGEIGATSEVGVGSTFFFNALFGTPSRPEQPTIQGFHCFNGERVLVIDDHATTRRVVAEMLNDMGLQPTVVATGAEGLAELTHAAALKEPYAYALVDALLGMEDGYTVARRIVAEHLAGMTVVLISSDDYQQDIQQCRELGIAHLRKPLRRGEVVRALQDSSEQTQAGDGRAPLELGPVSGGARRMLRILVADDNVFNQKVSRMKLERWGHHVKVVGSGAEALDALTEEEFDVLFTDIQMPEMDGFELAAAVQSMGFPLPIYALTADAMVGVQEKCMAAGMSGYITKPIRDEDFLAALAEVTPSADAETVQPFHEIGHDTVEMLKPNLAAVFDEKAALARVGGNRNTLLKLIETFEWETAEHIRLLEEGVQKGDAVQIRSAAHTIKGMVSFFGFAQATESAAQLERMGANSNVGGADVVYLALVAEMESIRSELSTYQAAPVA